MINYNTLTEDNAADNLLALSSTGKLVSVDKSTISGGGGASALDDLTDVTLTSPQDGDILERSGGVFVNTNNAFTELTGTTWDGSNKYKALTENLILTLSTNKVAGLLYISSNSTYTLSINGTAITINDTGDSIVGFIKQNGIYVISTDLSPVVIGAGDITSPTVVSMTAIDANTIEVELDEIVTATNLGWSFKQNGTPITPDSIGGSGTTTLTFTFSETLLDTDTFLGSYDDTTGDTEDVANNELVSFTDQAVTNGLSSEIYVTDDFSGGDDSDIAGRTTITGGGIWEAALGNTGLLKIESGLLRLNLNTLVAKYVIEAGIRNINTEATNGSVGSGNNVYLILGYTDESNYIQVHIQSGLSHEIVGGVPNELLAASFASLITGDVVRAKLDGSNLTVYKNGVQTATTSSVSGSITGTKSGINFYQEAGSSISNFETYAI